MIPFEPNVTMLDLGLDPEQIRCFRTLFCKRENNGAVRVSNDVTHTYGQDLFLNTFGICKYLMKYN